MAKYSIAELSEQELSEQQLQEYYCVAKSKLSGDNGDYPGFDFSDLDCIFHVASGSRGLFPKINIDDHTPASYIYRWAHFYCNERSKPHSGRIAAPKSSCSDPIVKKIAQTAKDLSDAKAGENEQAHTLFMSAENVLGNLLEEFLAGRLRKYGWIWCAGTTLRAIDFCSTDGRILLQVKNKNNSENSSSSNIREGTEIKKWYRLTTSRRGGKISPKYRWDILNAIVNDAKIVTTDDTGASLPDCALSEEKFSKYIEDVVKANKNIVTDQ